MYPIIKTVLFVFDSEFIHRFVFLLIKIIQKLPFFSFFTKKLYSFKHPNLERKVFGLSFPNPVGLAAGFDKNARLYKELFNYGFGFIEIGTVTPQPQIGNPKKRLFRLQKDKALINSMGFNNKGVEAVAERLKKNKNIIIGGNIGKNKNTPNEKAINDYKYCFEKLFPYVHYFAINVSSPNTSGLRELQKKIPLLKIVKEIKRLNIQKQSPKPILLKIAPDLSESELKDIVDVALSTKIDGVIATNSTLDRGALKSKKTAIERQGGLSGRPLFHKSNDVIRFLAKVSKNAFPIIGVGGIHSPEDALEKLKAGASLVQIYTGFVYEGPNLIKKINKKLAQHTTQNN